MGRAPQVTWLVDGRPAQPNEAARLALPKYKLSHIARAIKDEWERLAAVELSGSAAAVYAKGMRKPTIEDGQVTFSLVGKRAVDLELGWAPPEAAGGDGTGTYTGAPKDMRPMILKGASKKVIAFKEAKNPSDLVREAGEHLKAAIRGRGAVAARAQAESAFSKGLRGLPTGGKLGHQATAKVPPKTHTFSDGTVRRHYAYIYAGVVKEYGGRQSANKAKNKYTVYRTITNSPDQLARKLWFTEGIKPANIIDKLMASIDRIITETTAARGWE